MGPEASSTNAPSQNRASTKRSGVGTALRLRKMNVDGEATLECRRLRTTAEEAPKDPDLHRLATWVLRAAEPRRHHGTCGVFCPYELS